MHLSFKRIIILMFVCFSFPPLLSYTQESNTINPENENLFQKIENTVEQSEAEVDYSDIMEQLDYFLKHPININKSGKEDLNKLMILNDIQLNNLFEHIEKNGKLISLYELQSIDGFDSKTIENILPYICINNEEIRHFSLKEMLKNSENLLLIRSQQILEKQIGYNKLDTTQNSNSSYLGSPYALYTKYRFNYYQNIRFGITAEKDAGEEFFKGTQKKGFDFYSAHLYLKDFGLIKSLAFGDFQAQFGQGLTLWNGQAFGKTSDGTGIKKNGQGLSPYTSASDNLFLRGIGTTIGIKKIDFSVLFSSKKIDANITEVDSFDNNKITVVSTLQQSGDHSTASTLNDKDAISETSIGGNICYNNKNLAFGFTVLKNKYSASIMPELKPYNQYSFSGKENIVLGFDYQYVYKNINLFGEIAESKNKAFALISGALVCLDPKVSISILYRNYDKKFQSVYSSSFGENTTNTNEKGVYTGLVLKPIPSLSINAYMDRIRFPWLKFNVDEPSLKNEYALEINWKPSKKREMTWKYNQSQKKRNNTENGDITSQCLEVLKQNFRYQISYQVSPSIFFKNRVEIVRYKLVENLPEKGYLIYHDILYKKLNNPFSFSMRYALFDCNTYNARIYAFENDVLFAYAVPAYSNKGTRVYLNLHYRLNKMIDFWLRFSQTQYHNIKTIGSGLTQINGNTKTEIKAQCMLTF